MIFYNVKQAWIGVCSRPWLTFLMVIAIGIGIGIFMTALTMVYQNTKVDLPHKSDRLFSVQLDSRSMTADPVDHFNNMIDLTYQDAVALNKQDIPGAKTTFTWLTDHIVNLDNSDVKPYRGYSIVTTKSFFELMDIPFIYGNPWTIEQELAGEPVVVLTKWRNEYLFGGENSIGKQIRLNDQVVTVVGVMDSWNVRYRFYDRSFIQGLSDDAYLPYQLAIQTNMKRNARFECWDNTNMDFQVENVDELIASECGWVTFWAELQEPNNKAEFEYFLNQYVEDQRVSGRFPRPNNNFVTSLDEVMEFVHNNNVDNIFYFLIGGLFMSACVFSAIGVILTRFMQKRSEVSIRRAMGAKRKTLIGQYLSEVALIGMIGGFIGIAVTAVSLYLMKLKTFKSSSFYADIGDLDKLFQLDWVMMATAIAVAIFSAILIGIIPIWQVCHVQISQHLKAQ